MEFEEAQHAFDRALTLGCEQRAVWIELGRLWLKSEFLWRAEQAYTRARLLREDEAVLQKLQWIAGKKAGLPPDQREVHAATVLQSRMRGMLARKHVMQHKRKMQEMYEEEAELQFQEASYA